MYFVYNQRFSFIFDERTSFQLSVQPIDECDFDTINT